MIIAILEDNFNTMFFNWVYCTSCSVQELFISKKLLKTIVQKPLFDLVIV